jgi:hypothetical protein
MTVETQARARRHGAVFAAIAATTALCLLAACGSAGPSTGSGRHPTTTMPKVSVLTGSEHVKPATCPAHWRPLSTGVVPVSSAQARSVLVPPGPRWVTVCRYAGLNQRVPSGTLERSRVVTGTDLAQLVAVADKAETVPQGSYNCPFSQGLVDVLYFVYPTGRTVTVTVDVDGCVWAGNGQHTVWAGGITPLLKQWVGQDSLP